jgi:hypothetical protein
MDKPLTPEQKNIAIEEALHAYPLAPMPHDLTPDVMARIQFTPRPRPFHLSWSDLVLSVVIALCMSTVWFSLQQLPPLVVAQMRKETILLYQHILVNARWLIPTIFFGLAGFLAALTIPYLRQELKKST